MAIAVAAIIAFVLGCIVGYTVGEQPKQPRCKTLLKGTLLSSGGAVSVRCTLQVGHTGPHHTDLVGSSGEHWWNA